MKLLFSKKLFTIGLCTLLLIGCNSDKNNKELLGWKAGTFWSSSKVPHILLNRAIGEESNIVWSAGNHTASPLPLGAIGPEKYTQELKGIIQNTRIAEVLKEAVKEKKKVILVIGDGMGINHMSLPIYNNVAEQNKKKTYFEKIMKEGETGLVLSNPYGGIVTGSAAAATAFACGTKTHVGMVGVDHKGRKLTSILDIAEENELVTGLVTEASILDGTPGGFFANNKSRHAFQDIANQLIDEYEIEVLLGGGGEYFIPVGTQLSDQKEFGDINKSLDGKSKRKDKRNILDEFQKKGYKLVNTEDEVLALDKNNEKVVGLFSASGINAAVDRDNEKTGEPSLVQLAEKSLEILSADNKNYFVMIEAARIDWESHDNDAGAVYKAVEEVDRVLEVCYDEYKKDPENTILVFTADHETGGLGISYNHFHDRKIKEELVNGETFESSLNPLLFEEFHKLTEQKRSVYSIFKEVKSADELYKKLNKNLSYEVTREDAEIIYNALHNYRKSK